MLSAAVEFCVDGFDRNGVLRREPVQQRQPVEAFAEAPRKLIAPALAAQASPLADLLHGHSVDQHGMH